MNNFILVWSLILTSLCYCHMIGRVFPAGNIIRPLAILPVVCLFFLLPLNLTTLALGGTTSFFIAWLANFKLLLFAFGQGPLYTNPTLPLSHFLGLACLPIKAQQIPRSEKSDKSPKGKTIQLNPSELETTKKAHKSLSNYVFKIIALFICINLCHYKDHFIHPKLIWLLYLIQIYTSLEVLLAVIAALAQASIRVQLEPQFDEPYLATSLQDFWGKRWNLMVSNILRPTVYSPIRSFCELMAGKTIWRKWCPVPAMLVAFLVSGLMHELVFYNIGRLKPTGEATCFFLLSGISVAVEMGIKRLLAGRFSIPIILSRTLTLVFLVSSSFWLFFPPLLRANADLKGCTEILAFLQFLGSGRVVSPSDLSCPFL